MQKFFRDNRVLRVLRPTASILALFAALWHASHALSTWTQSHDYRATDPALADFFWQHFQKELGVTLAAFLAGIFAWHMFKPRGETESALRVLTEQKPQ